ncbi:hypothetical protein F2Q70_00042775 [Brassica cretica]|nr:hypothetical protein F2Q70_00042775 [Brassica cretica]
MIEKANRSFTRVRDHFARLDALGKAKNLYGQASGTKKCLEMIRDSRTEIPQDMIEMFRRTFDPYGSNVNLISPETASQLITSRDVTEEMPEEPLGDVTSAPTEQVVVPEEGVRRESRKKEGIEEIPEEGTPVAEEGVEMAGVEDPVVVSDSSSGEQDGEGDDDAGEISRSRPSEEEKTDDVVEGDAVSSPPGADLLTSTRPEETVAPIAEDPTERS